MRTISLKDTTHVSYLVILIKIKATRSNKIKSIGGKVIFGVSLYFRKGTYLDSVVIKGHTTMAN